MHFTFLILVIVLVLFESLLLVQEAECDLNYCVNSPAAGEKPSSQTFTWRQC